VQRRAPWQAAGCLHPARLCCLKCYLGARADQRALLLGQGDKEVKDERINISAQLRDHEGHPTCHQAADEVNVSRNSIQHGNAHRALPPAGFRQRSGQLGAAVKSVTAFAGLHFHEYPDKLEALGSSEAVQRLLLCLDAEAGLALLAGEDFSRNRSVAVP
jgi:hypothetical protein